LSAIGAEGKAMFDVRNTKFGNSRDLRTHVLKLVHENGGYGRISGADVPLAWNVKVRYFGEQPGDVFKGNVNYHYCTPEAIAEFQGMSPRKQAEFYATLPSQEDLLHQAITRAVDVTVGDDPMYFPDGGIAKAYGLPSDTSAKSMLGDGDLCMVGRSGGYVAVPQIWGQRKNSSLRDYMSHHEGDGPQFPLYLEEKHQALLGDLEVATLGMFIETWNRCFTRANADDEVQYQYQDIVLCALAEWLAEHREEAEAAYRDIVTLPMQIQPWVLAA
jgi:hypothetical protein